MLDFVSALLSAFGEFVKMLFALPFYGNISYGNMLVAIYVIGMILFFLIGRMR